MIEQNKKLAFFLPNTFTALNIGCGFTAILLAFNNKFYEACMILVLGAIFDSVDGRIARLTGTESNFGEQFDSMSDLISFGMAPALIFYKKFLIGFDRLGMVAAFVFLLCSALRLARFNANIEKVSSDFFQGLPTPTAAMSLVGLTLFSTKYSFVYIPDLFFIVFTFFAAFLMISNIPFPSFKQSQWIKKRKRFTLFLIILMLSFITLYEELMIGLIVLLYIFGSLIHFFINRQKFQGIFDLTLDEPNE